MKHSEAELDALWREHSERVVRFAGALVGPTDAWEIASEVLLASADALLCGDVTHPNAFLYRAVSNRAQDLRRSRERRWRRDLLAVPYRDIHTPDNHPEVRQAVAALSVNQRAVVFLAFWEDKPEREIAEVLGVALGTVRRHRVRADRHLRKALE